MRKIGLLLVMLSIIGLGCGHEIKVGTKVAFTADDGKQYTGTVTEVSDTAYKVHPDGFDEKYFYWMTEEEFTLVKTAEVTNTTKEEPPAANPVLTLTVGSKVEALSAKKWVSGTITEVLDGKYKIHYDGWTDYWDEWVVQDQLRAPGTNGDVKISLDKKAKGKLYLRHIRWLATGGSSLDWYFLADNGTIVVDPKHGTDPVNLAAERVDNMKNMGTYSIEGDLLKIKWVNGTNTDVEVEYKDGDICRIDAMSLVMRQTGVPAGYTLNGTYSGVTGVGNIAAGRTFSFSNNGSFTGVNTGYVSAEQGNATAEKNISGTYNITGNTLTLTYADGTIEKAPIAIWESRLVIGNVSLPLAGD